MIDLKNSSSQSERSKTPLLEWIDKQDQAFKLERQELRDAKQLRIEEAEDRNDQRALRSAKTIRINMEDIERKEVGLRMGRWGLLGTLDPHHFRYKRPR